MTEYDARNIVIPGSHPDQAMVRALYSLRKAIHDLTPSSTATSTSIITTTADFTMPLPGVSVPVVVTDTTSLVAGLTVYVQNAGYMLVQSVTDATHVVLVNVATVRTNTASGTTIPSGSKVIPSGPAGNSMIITRTEGVLIGTDETTGVTIANNASNTATEADLFGDNFSDGEIELYLKFTDSAASGTMDVVIYPSRVLGQPYPDDAVKILSVVPNTTTKKEWAGRFKCPRYLTAVVTNNATTASATNVTLGYNLYKYT